MIGEHIDPPLPLPFHQPITGYPPQTVMKSV